MCSGRLNRAVGGRWGPAEPSLARPIPGLGRAQGGAPGPDLSVRPPNGHIEYGRWWWASVAHPEVLENIFPTNFIHIFNF